MSVIENNAKPVTESLMRGESFSLTMVSQRLLASLLCLITIRVEFSDLATRAVPDFEREWLKDKSEPPPTWQIWIASYSDDNTEKHWCYHHGFVIVSSPDQQGGPFECNAQVTTLVIGKLCAHMFSAVDWADFGGYEGTRLCRIWPQSQFDINTQFLPKISERAVVSLAEALARETPPVPIS
jgi:hypothetical protein